MMHRAHDLDTLLAYAEGALPLAKVGEVTAHLASNAEDAQLVAQYRLIKQRLISDDSVEPSAAALARAKAIFNPATLVNRDKIGWLAAVDRFIARCVFDSRLEAIAVRSASAEQFVNMSYESPEADIDLQAERIESDAAAAGATRWQVLGQINTDDGAGGARIALTQTGSIAPLQECQADEHGSFAIQTVSGRYDLHIQLSNKVIVLPDVTMK